MKKTTQSQLRSIRQPPASGQRPKLVTRQNVMTAIQELIDILEDAVPALLGVCVTGVSRKESVS